MSEGPVRLRGHHFICLQFFHGEGYTDEYASALGALIERLGGDEAEVVRGADDVCAFCPHLEPGGACESADAGGEAEIARIDALAHEALGLHMGERVSLAEAARRLREDPRTAWRWRREACDGCTWEAVCVGGWERLLG